MFATPHPAKSAHIHCAGGQWLAVGGHPRTHVSECENGVGRQWASGCPWPSVSPWARNVRDREVRLQGGGGARCQGQKRSLVEPAKRRRLRPSLYVFYVVTNFRQLHFEAAQQTTDASTNRMGLPDVIVHACRATWKFSLC